jgi:hypothetical protein
MGKIEKEDEHTWGGGNLWHVLQGSEEMTTIVHTYDKNSSLALQLK